MVLEMVMLFFQVSIFSKHLTLDNGANSYPKGFSNFKFT